MVTEWLRSNMLSENDEPQKDAEIIVNTLGNHKKTFTHAKHIHIEDCKRLGIKVIPLENLEKKKIGGCKDLQDCVLTIHHTYMHTFSNSNAVKIVENHHGSAMIISMPMNVAMATR